jgi:uncharacterized membrane protein YfcA
MWLWILATVSAFFIKGLCGFANTLVFTSILGFGVNNVNISPIELVLGYPANLILTWKNRKKLDPHVFVPLIILVLLGNLPGAFLLKNTDAGAVKILFGVVIILLGIEMALRETGKLQFRESRLVLAFIGIVSGVLCGLFGVGALLAAYVGRVTDNGDSFKANISAVFFADNTFRLILYTALGIFTRDGFRQALILVPFMLLGLFAGMKSCSVLDEKFVRRLVIGLLILSGIIMILKNIG